MKISVITPSIRPEGLKIIQDCLQKQTLKDFEWITEIGFPNKSDLNISLNRAIKRSTGKLLVFYQDFISIPNDALEKFWEAYERYPNTFFTAAVNNDWRTHKENQERPLEFHQWEIDWGACPRDAMFKIGGFDETLDQFWGFDNVNIGLRAVMAGYQIYAINNPSIGQKHEEAPMKRLRNPSYHNQRLMQIRQGLKIDYLTI